MSWNRRYRKWRVNCVALRTKTHLAVWVGIFFQLPGSAFTTELTPTQIYQSASPATVLVAVQSKDLSGHGTGSIVDSSGLVLTNHHVIFNEEAKAPHEIILVILKPEKVIGDDRNPKNLVNRYKTTIVASSEAYDLALLKIINPPHSLPVLPIGDPSQVTMGSRVAAIGHPEKGGLWSLTTGVISAEWQDYRGIPGWDIFQTETSLNWGNSGGPLIDMEGKQIGINSFIQRRSQTGLALTSINFAIKSSVAKEWLSRQGVHVAYATPVPSTRVSQPTQPKDNGNSTHPGDLNPGPAKNQPTEVLVNQPEAEPETGPGLPPLRPFSLDRLVKGIFQVEQDLESQMEDMEAEIRKRRK